MLGGNEPDLPDTWRFSSMSPAHGRRRRRAHAGVAHGADALGDGHEPGSRRRLRHAARRWSGAGSAAAPATAASTSPGSTTRTSRARVRLLIERDDLEARSTSPRRSRCPTPSSCARCARRGRARRACPRPRWMLEAGAFVMRTETELVLKSRRVVPAACSRRASLRVPGLAGGGARPRQPHPSG